MVDEDRQPLLGSGSEPVESPEPATRHQDFEAPSADIDAKPKPSERRELLDLVVKIAAVVVSFAATGLAQAAVGAMIPAIEPYYGLKNGPTAFIFPAALAGYLTAVSAIEKIHLRFGRRGIALIGPALRVAGAIVLMWGPPFPLALAGYFIFGTGSGLTDSGFCAWGSGVPYTNVVQGIIHGSWSTGCVLGPQVVALIFKKGYPWHSFYFVLGLICCVECVALGLAFRKDDGPRYRAVVGELTKSTSQNPLRLRQTWMCGLFWFVYVGIESSYGDWIVTYMSSVRHVDHLTAASASSVFWIGMVTGRILLSGVTERVGIQWSVAAYIVLSIVAQVTFQALTNVAALLSMLAAVGFFFGPFFPSGIVLLANKLPNHTHVGAVSAAAALGQIGGATCPLIVGFMADAFGMAKLLDVATVLTVVLLAVWVAFCRS